MHSYLGMVWFAVHFCHKACGISRTNCQGQSWKNPWWKPSKASILAQLMFAGTIYLLAVTLCSSFVHFGRLAHLPAFQSYRGPLDHSRKWFHWKVSVVCDMSATPVPGLSGKRRQHRDAADRPKFRRPTSVFLNTIRLKFCKRHSCLPCCHVLKPSVIRWIF